ncbi:prolyl endopeptidase-like [Planococcus citri]|uniref:prolyl endopeptidase-like n=1 Tax=Planococcus citri TaxID=170843 RepID=UPI0031F8853F
MTSKLYVLLGILVVFTPPTSPSTPVTSPNPPTAGTPSAGFIPADKYPNARRDESVEDTYPGGVKIKDPYQWLENPDSSETKKFIEEEMAITKPYLEKSPFRAELHARYTELSNYSKLKGPFQEGKYFYSFRNTGLQNQDVLFKSDSFKDEGKVFLDVNKLSKDGTVAIGTYEFSNDGNLFAYLLGSGGSDWKTVHFMDVEKGCSMNTFVGNNENQFIFQTNKDADNFKLIVIDITNPDPGAWKDLIPEDKKYSMDWAGAAYDNYLVLGYIEDVKSVVQLHDMKTGKMIKKFPLEVGTVAYESIFGGRRTPHVFFNFVSFLTPGITYHFDLSKPPFDLEVINEIKLKNFDREKFTVEQLFYPSKDGTKVPMYCVHKKHQHELTSFLMQDLEKNGNNFAFMYAYGIYGVSNLPYFAVNRLVVISNFDGVHCMANIRGGG